MRFWRSRKTSFLMKNRWKTTFLGLFGPFWLRGVPVFTKNASGPKNGLLERSKKGSFWGHKNSLSLKITTFFLSIFINIRKTVIFDQKSLKNHCFYHFFHQKNLSFWLIMIFVFFWKKHWFFMIFSIKKRGYFWWKSIKMDPFFLGVPWKGPKTAENDQNGPILTPLPF